MQQTQSSMRTCLLVCLLVLLVSVASGNRGPDASSPLDPPTRVLSLTNSTSSSPQHTSSEATPNPDQKNSLAQTNTSEPPVPNRRSGSRADAGSADSQSSADGGSSSSGGSSGSSSSYGPGVYTPPPAALCAPETNVTAAAGTIRADVNATSPATMRPYSPYTSCRWNFPNMTPGSKVNFTVNFLEVDMNAGLGFQYVADPPLNYSYYASLGDAGREALDQAERELVIGQVRSTPSKNATAPITFASFNEKGLAIILYFSAYSMNTQLKGFSLDYVITPPPDPAQLTASVSFTAAVKGKFYGSTAQASDADFVHKFADQTFGDAFARAFGVAKRQVKIKTISLTSISSRRLLQTPLSVKATMDTAIDGLTNDQAQGVANDLKSPAVRQAILDRASGPFQPDPNQDLEVTGLQVTDSSVKPIWPLAVGVAVGGFVFLALVTGLTIYCIRKRRQAQLAHATPTVFVNPVQNIKGGAVPAGASYTRPAQLH